MKFLFNHYNSNLIDKLLQLFNYVNFLLICNDFKKKIDFLRQNFLFV